MSKIHWSKQVSADFNTAADWGGGTVPGSSDDAILDASGLTKYTVTASTSETVLGIQTASTATLSITGGTFTATKGTDGGINAGTIAVGDLAVLSFGGTFANSGTIAVNGGPNYAQLNLTANATLSGGGKLTLSDFASNTVQGPGFTLTNVNNTISGAGSLGAGNLNIVNQAGGVINATGTGTNALTISTPGTLSNAGVIEATGVGGLTINSTTIANTGTLAAAGGAVNLSSDTIIGGTLTSSGKGVINVNSVTLDGSKTAVTNSGVLAVADLATLNILGSITNAGAIDVNGGPNYAQLILTGNATLAGGGKVNLSDFTGNTVQGSSFTLTNVDNTISGAGALGAGNLNIVNQAGGVINASGTTNALTIAVPGTFSNAGLIEDTGAGGLTFAGGTVANTGSIAAGAIGLVTISSATISDSGLGKFVTVSGSKINLSSGTIAGGPFTLAAGGALATTGGTSAITASTFTNQGVVTINDLTALDVQGAIANSGTIAVNGGPNYAQLNLTANATLSGGGKLTLSDFASNTVQGPGFTLTNVNNTISGAGSLGAGNLNIVNQAGGVINATGTGTNALTISTPGTLSNAGVIEATGVGGLTINSTTIANTGTLAAAGGAVNLSSDTIIGGTLTSSGKGVINVNSVTLDGSKTAVTNSGVLAVADLATLNILGSITNAGAIDVNGGPNYAQLILTGNATLAGGGKVNLSDFTGNTVQGSSFTLTNVDNTISGAGALGAGNLNIVNQAGGVINASGTTNALTIAVPGTFSNAGLIEDTGAGGLTFAGGTVANTGSIAAGAIGLVTISSATISDSGLGKFVTVSGSKINLSSGTIAGGPFTLAAGGALATTGGTSAITASTFTNQGVVTINDLTALDVQGAIANSGTIAVNGGPNYAQLNLTANATLSGGGKLTLSDFASNTVQGPGFTLTNVNNTISGAGSLGAGNLNIVNQAGGVINATGTGTNALTISTPGTLSNAGVIEATGVGGLTINSTTIANTGTLAAAGGAVNLSSDTIIGGTLTSSGKGVINVNSVTLDGSKTAVTNSGVLAVADLATLNILGSITNAGAIDVNGGPNYAQLILTGNATLAGGGKVNLSDFTGNTVQGSSFTLTNVDNTISGAGALGAGNLNIVNQAGGVINASGTTNALTIAVPGTFSNAGLIEDTGAGGLIIKSQTFSGKGTILAGSGLNVNLFSNDLIGQTLAGAGTFTTTDSNTVLDGTSITTGVSGTLDVANGTSITAKGTVNNSGTINLASTGTATDLLIDTTKNLTLTGGGLLAVANGGFIQGLAGGAAAFSNADTITGQGTIFSSAMTLNNLAGGLIENSGANTLNLSGPNTITNGGALEATGGGALSISSVTIANTGGTILAASGSTVSLSGDVIVGGTLTTGGSGTITATGSRLDGSASAVTNAGAFKVLDNSSLIIKGQIDNTGTITLASFGDPTHLYIDPAGATLSGSGVLDFQVSFAGLIGGVSFNPATLTNAGNIIEGSSILFSPEVTLVNQSGIVESVGGNLFLDNAITNSGGVLEGAGGNTLVITNTTVDQSGGGTILAASGSSVHLTSADIIGGTLAGVGSISTTDSGSTLDGSASAVAVTGALSITDGTSLTVKGTLANAGQVIVAGTGDPTNFMVEPAGVTLTGAGVVSVGLFGAGGLIEGVAGGVATLTNAGNTISGKGVILHSKLTLDNQSGVVENSGAATLTLSSPQIVTNGGTLEGAGGGTLSLGGTIDGSSGGTILAADTSSVSLASADIIGGILATSGTGTIFTADNASVLDGSTASVVNNGVITITDKTSLTLNGAVVNSGTIKVASTVDATDLLVGGAGVTLSGGGTVAVAGAGVIQGVGGNPYTLTNAGDIITGGGTIFAPNLHIVNGAKGTIDGNAAAALTMGVLGNTFFNSGLMEGTGAGGLALTSMVLDQTGGGTVLAADTSLVTLATVDVIGGTLAASGSGTISTLDSGSVLDGAKSAVANTGVLDIADGTSLTFKGTIANSGTINIASAGSATFLVDPAGVTLTGGGLVSANAAGVFSTGANPAILTNAGDTIAGAGSIFTGKLSVVNASGVIENSGKGTLALTGSITNSGGTLEGQGGGVLSLGTITVDQSSGGTILAADKSTVLLSSADIIGGTLATVGTGVIATADKGSTLDGSSATVTNLDTLSVADNTLLTILGAISNKGTIAVQGSANSSSIVIGGATTLSGGGQVAFSTNLQNFFYATAAATLTNVNNTISGAGTVGNGFLTIVNQSKGVIDGNAPNVLIVSTPGGPLTNTGLIEATSGGSVNIDNTAVDQSTGGAIFADTGSKVSLTSVTIEGGTLTTSGTGVIVTTDSASDLDGTKSAIANKGLLKVADTDVLTLEGSIANGGTISLAGATATTGLVIGKSTTLSGKGQVSLTDNAFNEIVDGGTAVTLTNLDNTIAGSGQIGSAKLTLANAGTIDATGSKSALVLGAAGEKASNAGLIEATGKAGLTLSGLVLDQSAGGTILSATGSKIALTSATIIGGTLNGAGTISTTDSGSVLDARSSALTVKGKVTVTDKTSLTIEGALNNTGTVTLASTADATGLIIAAAGATLSGGGTVSLTGVHGLIEGATSAATLTNVDNTISGAGFIGVAKLTMVNEAAGVIDANAKGGIVLRTDGKTLANAGLIEATGSGRLIILNTTVDDSKGGSIDAGATVDIQNSDIIGGTVTSTAGGALVINAVGAVLDGTSGHALTMSGRMVLGDGSSLTLEGSIIDKSGSITLTGGAHQTQLLLAAAGATLSGGGTVVLSNRALNHIGSAGAGAVLTNVDNKIVGSGTIGDLNMRLVNDAAGYITSSYATALIIDTGSNTIVNAGRIVGVGSGGTMIHSAVNNTGLLVALHGNLTVTGAVSGNGVADILGGTMAFGSSFSENVNFTTASPNGVLQLAQSVSYTGIISGFSHTANATKLDLRDIGFNVGGHITTASWSQASGILTVTDNNGDTAHIHMTGTFGAGDFTVATDSNGGIFVTDPPGGALAPPHAAAHFASAMAGFGAGAAHAPSPAAPVQETVAPMLAGVRAHAYA